MRLDFKRDEPRPKLAQNQITPEERALIDEAIAAGRVQVVPLGVTSVPKLVWDEAAKQIVHAGQRVLWNGRKAEAKGGCQDAEAKGRKAWGANLRAINEDRVRAASALDPQIAKMRAEGMRGWEIMAAVGIGRGSYEAAVRRIKASDDGGGNS